MSIVTRDLVQEKAILAAIPQDGQDTAQWLIEQYYAVNAENNQLRERNAELGETQEELYKEREARLRAEAERDEAREHTAELAQDLYIAKVVATAKATQENTRGCDACQLHAEMQDRQRKIDDIRRRILKLNHTQMDSSDKLVALDYLEQASARNWDIADLCLPFHPVMEQLAERTGLSEAQLTRINKTQKTANSWKYDVKRELVKKVGRKKIYNCTVTVELDKLINDPSSIEKPPGPKGAHQGGERVRRCKDCGSDDLDRTAIEYCRSCNKAHLQILPGLRSDADFHEIVQAIKEDRYTIQNHLHDYAEDDSQEHDAFTAEELAELDAELGQSTNEPKHDAFFQPEALAEQPALLDEQTQEPEAPTGQHDDQELHTAGTIIQFPGNHERKHDASTPEDIAQIDQEIVAFTNQFVQQPEVQPILAALGKTMSEQDQRYEEAVKIIEDLATYGYTLEYQTDGRRRLHKTTQTESTPSHADLSALRNRIIQYDAEVRDCMGDLVPATSEQKHDASVQDTHQVAEQQPASRNMQDRVCNTVSLHVAPVCRATYYLNASGQPSGAREKVTGSRECGSTQWRWSIAEQEYICVRCSSPQPRTAHDTAESGEGSSHDV